MKDKIELTEKDLKRGKKIMDFHHKSIEDLHINKILVTRYGLQ